MKTFVPIGEKVLVEPIMGGNQKVGHIHIPEAHRDEKPAECMVVSLGRTNKPFEVKVGDRVLVDRWLGTEVQMGSRSYKLIEAQNILAIID